MLHITWDLERFFAMTGAMDRAVSFRPWNYLAYDMDTWLALVKRIIILWVP